MKIASRTFRTEADANAFADQHNAVTPGRPYYVVERVYSDTYRRYFVRCNPQVGDDVSEGFNGDSYYRGKVIRVTATKAVTDQGHVFRKDKHGRWHNGGWSMAFGVFERRNPHF